MLSSQGKNAPSNRYPHYLVRLGSLKDCPVPRSSSHIGHFALVLPKYQDRWEKMDKRSVDSFQGGYGLQGNYGPYYIGAEKKPGKNAVWLPWKPY